MDHSMASSTNITTESTRLCLCISEQMVEDMTQENRELLEELKQLQSELAAVQANDVLRLAFGNNNDNTNNINNNNNTNKTKTKKNQVTPSMQEIPPANHEYSNTEANSVRSQD